MAPPSLFTSGAPAKDMFSAGQQRGKGYLEVFTSSGSDPTSWWHKADKSKIPRQYSSEIKAYYIQMGSDATLPRPPKNLHLLQSHVVFQAYVPSNSNGFRVNFLCTTLQGSTRSIFLSSLLKVPLLGNIQRKSLPIPLPTDNWINLAIDVNDLLQYYFNETLAHVDRIQIQPSMKLRRIFTLDKKPTPATFSLDPAQNTGEIPQTLLLPQEVGCKTVIYDPTTINPVAEVPKRKRPMPKEEEAPASRAGEADDSLGEEEEFPGLVVVTGRGPLLTLEERKALDEALEDMDGNSSEDSCCIWDLPRERKANLSIEDAAEMHRENARLLAGKRRADARTFAIDDKLDKIKNQFDQPDVRRAQEETLRAKTNAVWSETHLEDLWTELCQERSRNREMERELQDERRAFLLQRAQLRSLQALLMKLDAHAKQLGKVLEAREAAFKPLRQEFTSEKNRLQGEIDKLTKQIKSEGGGVAIMREEITQKDAVIKDLQDQVERGGQSMVKQEEAREAEKQEQQTAARLWAKELTALKAEIRGLEGVIAELNKEKIAGASAREEAKAMQERFNKKEAELDSVRAEAGRVQHECSMLRAELQRARQAVALAQVEREAEADRLVREQVLQFARHQIEHDETVRKLKERTTHAEKHYRNERMRRLGAEGKGADVLFQREEGMGSPCTMCVDSLEMALQT